MAQISVENLAVGKWLLLGADTDPEGSPVHGVKLVFHHGPAGFVGAIVNWMTGDEIPLARIDFDGSTLELQMEPDDAGRAGLRDEIPRLIMSPVDNHFEGYWRNAIGEKLGGPLAPRLKMVPYRH